MLYWICQTCLIGLLKLYIKNIKLFLCIKLVCVKGKGIVVMCQEGNAMVSLDGWGWKKCYCIF